MQNPSIHTKDFPIELPGNSYVNASVKFGKEQLIAGFTNIIGTLLSSEFLKNSALTELQKRTMIAISGPVFEKLGFYLSSFRKSWEIYRTTDPSIRNLIMRTAREGTKNTVKDLGVHDPAYLLLMGAGQAIYPHVPAWMISFISFVVATIVVGTVDVGFDELKYEYFKKNLKQQGFGIEKYYESRIALFKEYHMQDILEDLMKEFDLNESQKRNYNDTYYVVDRDKMKTYNGRKASFRLRSRYRIDQESAPRKSAQIVYTKANEITPSGSMHLRYYATKKEKIYLSLDALETLDDLSDIPYPHIVSKLQKSLLPTPPQIISFDRSLSYDSKGLMVSVDEIHANHPLQQTIELKVFEDIALLREATRYTLTQYAVQQTTMRKHSEENFGK